MSFIAICGGGGKTTICKKYPNLFIDIDVFIWSDINKKYHNDLIKAINNENTQKIGEIYKKIMIKNKYNIDRNKIILGHNEIYAEWLELKFIFSIKPNKKIHRFNIRNRDKNLQNISINCWENQKKAYIYNSYYEFENKLLKLFSKKFH